MSNNGDKALDSKALDMVMKHMAPLFEGFATNFHVYDDSPTTNFVRLDHDYNGEALRSGIRKILFRSSAPGLVESDECLFGMDKLEFGIVENPGMVDSTSHPLIIGSRNSADDVRRIVHRALMQMDNSSSDLFIRSLVTVVSAHISFVTNVYEQHDSRPVQLSLKAVELPGPNGNMEVQLRDKRAAAVLLIVNAVWSGSKLMTRIKDALKIFSILFWRRSNGYDHVELIWGVENVAPMYAEAVWLVLRNEIQGFQARHMKEIQYFIIGLVASYFRKNLTADERYLFSDYKESYALFDLESTVRESEVVEFEFQLRANLKRTYWFLVDAPNDFADLEDPECDYLVNIRNEAIRRRTRCLMVYAEAKEKVLQQRQADADRETPSQSEEAKKAYDREWKEYQDYTDGKPGILYFEHDLARHVQGEDDAQTRLVDPAPILMPENPCERALADAANEVRLRHLAEMRQQVMGLEAETDGEDGSN